MAKPNLSNLQACVDEATTAWLEIMQSTDPEDPTDYSNVVARLQKANREISPLHRKMIWRPITDLITDLGEKDFNKLLSVDPEREKVGGVVLDFLQAIFQHAEKYEEDATLAFQEVVNDLFDGFLSAEDRRSAKRPDFIVIPPLVKWGDRTVGPYTLLITDIIPLGISTSIVALPTTLTRKGIALWTSLAHETTGHNILLGDKGLRSELRQIVRQVLTEDFGKPKAEYWALRIDEVASDVLGVLNMGPAAAIGLIIGIKGIRAARGGSSEAGKLQTTKKNDSPYPIDALRAYLVAGAVERLAFSDAHDWAESLRDEINKDVGEQTLDVKDASTNAIEISFSKAESIAIANKVAEIIVEKQLVSLDGFSFGNIQNWRNRDEEVLLKLSGFISTPTDNLELVSKFVADKSLFAAHVVASTLTTALSNRGDLNAFFTQMIKLLKAMHLANAPAIAPYNSDFTRFELLGSEKIEPAHSISGKCNTVGS